MDKKTFNLIALSVLCALEEEAKKQGEDAAEQLGEFGSALESDMHSGNIEDGLEVCKDALIYLAVKY